nr:hypothetical protein [Tanacetum cinerariifolium]
TPLFEGMIADRQPAEEELGAKQVQVDAAVAAAVVEDVVEDVAEDVAHVATPSHPPHGIPSPPQDPSSPPQQPHDTPPVPTQEVVTAAKLITEVVTAAASQGSAASVTIPARSRRGITFKTPAETPKVKDKGKGILIEALKPMKKKDQIEMDAEYARKLQEEIDRYHDGFNKDVDWDAVMDHVNQKSSSNPEYIKRYQGMKKRPQTESEAQKNMMIYLKNTTGNKMDFFKGMTYA